MTLEQIAKLWVQNCLEGKDYDRQKYYENIMFKGNTIYSYGQWWDIATYTGELFIINESRASASTNNHTSIVQAAIREALTGNKYGDTSMIVYVNCRDDGYDGYPRAHITKLCIGRCTQATINRLDEAISKGREGSMAQSCRRSECRRLKDQLKQVYDLHERGQILTA